MRGADNARNKYAQAINARSVALLAFLRVPCYLFLKLFLIGGGVAEAFFENGTC